MDLAEFYTEYVKEAGLVGPTDEEIEAAVEVLKTAGLIEVENEEVQDEEISQEKVAAVSAVMEQFDEDGFEFEEEQDKIAAALEIVEEYEEELEKEAASIYSKAKKGLTKLKRTGFKGVARKVDDVVAGAKNKKDLAIMPTGTSKFSKGLKRKILARRAGIYGGAGAGVAGGGYLAMRRKDK